MLLPATPASQSGLFRARSGRRENDSETTLTVDDKTTRVSFLTTTTTFPPSRVEWDHLHCTLLCLAKTRVLSLSHELRLSQRAGGSRLKETLAFVLSVQFDCEKAERGDGRLISLTQVQLDDQSEVVLWLPRSSPSPHLPPLSLHSSPLELLVKHLNRLNHSQSTPSSSPLLPQRQRPPHPLALPSLPPDSPPPRALATPPSSPTPSYAPPPL